MKKIAILGSTGSIGTQTLSVIEEHADDFEVTALACGNNIRLLEEQMRKFRPKLVAVWSKEAAASLRVRTADLGIPVETGMDGLLAVATYEESEILVTAIVGMLGIRPTIAAIKAKKNDCPGKQRNVSYGRTSDYSACSGVWSVHSSGRQ